MDQSLEEQVRSLAKPLWESAARPYGMAMDFWLMAEQMVLEMMAATARAQNKAVNPPPLPLHIGDIPAAAPVHRVQELAECMWESAGRQYGMAQDFWLSAERHVLALLRAVSLPAERVDARATQLAALSPSAYLEQIRLMAYLYWDAAGRNYGRAFDYWLQAERDVLAMMEQTMGDRTAAPVEFGDPQPTDVSDAAMASDTSSRKRAELTPS